MRTRACSTLKRQAQIHCTCCLLYCSSTLTRPQHLPFKFADSWPVRTYSASDGYKCPGGAAVKDADIEVFPLPAAALAAANAMDGATVRG
jgi:hypothetical protein